MSSGAWEVSAASHPVQIKGLPQQGPRMAPAEIGGDRADLEPDRAGILKHSCGFMSPLRNT